MPFAAKQWVSQCVADCLQPCSQYVVPLQSNTLTELSQNQLFEIPRNAYSRAKRLPCTMCCVPFILSLAATMLEQWTCICRKGQVPCLLPRQSLLFRLVQHVHFLTFFFQVNANGANEIFVCSILSHMHCWSSNSSFSGNYVLNRSAKDFLSLHHNAIVIQLHHQMYDCHEHENRIFWFASGQKERRRELFEWNTMQCNPAKPKKQVFFTFRFTEFIVFTRSSPLIAFEQSEK